MILIEINGKGRVCLHNGHIKTEGPERLAELTKIVRAAVKRAGCAPEEGEPDMHAARILIEVYGGRILEHETTTISGRTY